MPSSATEDILPTIPSTQRAILQGINGKAELAQNASMPPISPNEVLVRTTAVALNPTDHKMPTYFPSPGSFIGCDFAGTVVRVGSKVAQPPSPIKVGDRVCGAVNGSNPIDRHSGSFAEYVKADAGLVLKVPEIWTWEKAAAIGVAIETVCLSLWRSLGLQATPENPSENPVHVLVYGGSTATGTMAIQVLKLCGLKPITTCSPRNFSLVKGYGAEEAFDYSSPKCAQDIKTYTKNSLRYVLDCITDVESVQICYASIGRTGGRYSCLELPPQHLLTRKAVKSEFVMALEIYGKEVALELGYEREARPEVYQAGVKWFQMIQRLLDEGKLQAHPVKVVPGGFEGIFKGLELLKRGAVSGQKLVVRIP